MRDIDSSSSRHATPNLYIHNKAASRQRNWFCGYTSQSCPSATVRFRIENATQQLSAVGKEIPGCVSLLPVTSSSHLKNTFDLHGTQVHIGNPPLDSRKRAQRGQVSPTAHALGPGRRALIREEGLWPELVHPDLAGWLSLSLSLPNTPPDHPQIIHASPRHSPFPAVSSPIRSMRSLFTARLLPWPWTLPPWRSELCSLDLAMASSGVDQDSIRGGTKVGPPLESCFSKRGLSGPRSLLKLGDLIFRHGGKKLFLPCSLFRSSESGGDILSGTSPPSLSSLSLSTHQNQAAEYARMQR